jgi:hypothetical protein
MVARANQFFHWTCSVPALAKGTRSYKYPSLDNAFLASDADNATRPPNVEEGATAYYSNNRFFWNKPAFASTGIADGAMQAQRMRNAISTETLRIYNGSSNHERFSDGRNEWSQNIDNATGNLRISRVEGQGLILLEQSVKSTGAVVSNAPQGGIGYATGAGGSVTQAANKSQGVTLNKVSGQITMNNAPLTPGAKVSFNVMNSAVAGTDVPVCGVAHGGTENAYRVAVTAISAGKFTVTVENISGVSLSESPTINCNVIKGASS